MKKVFLTTSLLIACATWAFSQATILFSKHALQAGNDNPMKYCNYLEPGQAGGNIIWDFRDLQFEQPFIGFVKKSQLSSYNALFPKANTELIEFNAQFYFNVNEYQTEQYGYVSADGKTKITYTTPFIKMKYPFTYGNAYSGFLTGIYEFSNTVQGTIAGNYTVEADAFGTLILPDDVRFENVLRIKTTKTYEIDISKSIQKVEIVTYRWYNGVHRYPLLVLTTYNTCSGNNNYLNYQAAYNSDAINTLKTATNSSFIESARLYPNPSNHLLWLDMEVLNKGTLNFEICDVSGKIIQAFNRQAIEAGKNTFDLSPEISGLKPAPYVLIIHSGDTKKIIDFSIVE